MFSVPKKIKILNSPNFKSSNINSVEENIGEFKLFDFLQLITAKHLVKTNGFYNEFNVCVDESNASNKTIQIPKYVGNVLSLFSPENFLSNFKQTFGVEFPHTLNIKTNKFLTSLHKTVSVNIQDCHAASEQNVTICFEQITYFKLVLCMCLNFLPGPKISISECDCCPEDDYEFIFFNMNLGLNCIKKKCQDRIFNYPNELDSTFVSNCDNVIVQKIMFNNNIANSNDLKINLNINQNVRIN